MEIDFKLHLISSELSMVILENEKLASCKVYKILENYIDKKFNLNLDNKYYVIEQAYAIYNKL